MRSPHRPDLPAQGSRTPATEPSRTPPPLVIGLTGPNAAGKGEVAAYLSRLGFAVHSLSDIVREEALARGLSTGREDLIAVGNRLRREHGPGVLAERVVARLAGRAVVDSIRSPAEVAVLRTRLPRFVLVGVDAPVEVRFERARQRARAGDPGSLAEFLAREEEENRADPSRQQLRATLALADYRIDNRGTLQALHRAVDALLRRLGEPAER